MTESSVLFSPLRIHNLTLSNRITMAPLYLGYAGPDGGVTPLMLDHYRAMAASGASLIVVENSAILPIGMGTPSTIRADDDRFLPGLSELAQAIHSQGALAFLQINHAGRYAYLPERMAPSPVTTGGVTPKEMTEDDIQAAIRAYADAAARVKAAGFDGVEIHGGTGYLIVQFLSARTNHRSDQFGGSLENRVKFPLAVVRAVQAAVGREYPVGYRFLADEELPDGLHVKETSVLAAELNARGVAYLSVMSGTYDSFGLPEYREREKQEGYMVSYAAEIKKAAPRTPVITAGRIQTPEMAERILTTGKADLIGLARVLFTDPLWPQKAKGVDPAPITPCEPTCALCTKRIMSGKPAICAQWPQQKRQALLDRFGEPGE